MTSRTSVEIEDGVACITMDDGKVNALSTEMMGEIARALDTAEAAGAIAILTGREGIFSAGFDLGTFKRGRDASVQMVLTGAKLVQRLLSFPYPVIAACTGHAYPMGAFLMLSSDVRFAVAGPWRIGMNEVAIGLTVPKFAIELARHRLTPPGFARITTASMFGPEEALRLGYLDRVVDAGQLDETAKEEAFRLRQLDMPSYAATKARVNERALVAIRAAVEAELGDVERPDLSRT
jgi:enoyl-CoA hydratase